MGIDQFGMVAALFDSAPEHGSAWRDTAEHVAAGNGRTGLDLGLRGRRADIRVRVPNGYGLARFRGALQCKARQSGVRQGMGCIAGNGCRSVRFAPPARQVSACRGVAWLVRARQVMGLWSRDGNTSGFESPTGAVRTWIGSVRLGQVRQVQAGHGAWECDWQTPEFESLAHTRCGWPLAGLGPAGRGVAGQDMGLVGLLADTEVRVLGAHGRARQSSAWSGGGSAGRGIGTVASRHPRASRGHRR